jgi:signal transduction histidine kinase
VMELQSGFLAFKARIQADGGSISLPPPGSRLELTGVYAPQGKGMADGSVSGFDILLSSAEGIRVRATPPWWTFKRVLILTGVLAAVLCGVLIWNKELHSKVEERGRQLETEIRNRQRAEMQRAAEAERARIARDLHDELGTGLTEVSLLASAGLGQYQDGEKIRSRFHNIGEKARELVSSLDFIVWAIDSRRNSLQSFADYIGHYARELLSSAAIDCRLRIRMEEGEISLAEAERHSLFLAVKEALNNVIRHASATEVEVQLSQVGDCMQIMIADNGRGFDLDLVQRGNGLTNLRERLQAMQGECQFESHSGTGTTVKFVVPITGNPSRTPSEIT